MDILLMRLITPARGPSIKQTTLVLTEHPILGQAHLLESIHVLLANQAITANQEPQTPTMALVTLVTIAPLALCSNNH
jgi:hypothetical protein